MKFGYLSVNTASGILPGPLARELEQRGYESLWVPEHSHIPIASENDYPAGGALPDGYAHALSPLISLTAAAASTSTLTLGTGVCLPLEHELMDLACASATLDTLSGGRLILGAGVGWNAQELANARPGLAFKQRYSALRERILALRAAWGSQSIDYRGQFAGSEWGQQISQFSGQFEQFSPSWVFPKPVHGGIPVALGLTGPVGIRLAAELADIWLPVDIALRDRQGQIDVEGHLHNFRQQLQAAGRAEDAVAVTLFVWSDVTASDIERYASLGIERIVFGPPSFHRHDTATTLRRLDDLDAIIATVSVT